MLGQGVIIKSPLSLKHNLIWRLFRYLHKVCLPTIYGFAEPIYNIRALILMFSEAAKTISVQYDLFRQNEELTTALDQDLIANSFDFKSSCFGNLL